MEHFLESVNEVITTQPWLLALVAWPVSTGIGIVFGELIGRVLTSRKLTVWMRHLKSYAHKGGAK